MLKLILVRHGETLWNREHRVQGGGSDTELAARGREQAERIAQALKNMPLDAIYSSPLRRAQDTAKAISHSHGVQIMLDPNLKELHTGELEGVYVETLRKSLFQYMVAEEGVGFMRLPGGESIEDLSRRVSPAVDAIIHRHQDGVVVMVSHYFALAAIVCHLMHIPLANLGRLRLEPGGTTILHVANGKACLMSFNVPLV